ncbi:putative Ntn-hydrolase superfamily protein [Rhizobium sp. BK275]|uniref:DUF1028 domain-containing protein n=1 Tax=unclassified Rhizobium TaxID=2613769 RepID=UPI001609ACFF|nr:MULTISPECIES: DUF1028 domain-containing protein [unclassified Rhizobium]MBB3391327.1 putative Ntn-hydrolase superfamily protein [Rhizobium sp. BK275]MBB3411699.1 putative Ntn-hydrolase superfamily protein [Rhizobium sp. BK316]
MTWSMVARDPQTGYLGIAVATRFFAVGGLVPHIRGGIGAVATQAFVSPLYGTDGLVLLAGGKAPDEIIAELTSRDAGRDQRQFHLIDAAGRNAAFTGTKCIDWAGHLVDDNISVAGNMLAGPEVVAQTLAAYKKAMDKPFIARLLEAMQAGEDAGGDKRGKQSAALLVHRDQDYPWLSIRADDHPDPLAELHRLYAVAQERYMHVAETMATKANPDGMIDRREIDEKIAALEAARIAEGRPSASFATPLKT